MRQIRHDPQLARKTLASLAGQRKQGFIQIFGHPDVSEALRAARAACEPAKIGAN
jgi:hypothetical protein